MDARQWQQLDLNLLRLFVVLNEEQNLSRAAERLHITPSAVSHALKRLRSHFNDDLFERHGTKMRPTPFCKRVYPLVGKHLEALFEALKQASVFEPSNSELTVRIAMPDALEQIVLPDLVSHLSNKVQQLRVDSVVLQRAEMESALLAGDIDFALDVERPIGQPVSHCPVLEDSFCVLGWEQLHPETLTLETYLVANHIGVSRRPQGATVEDLALRQAGLDRQTVMRCQTYQAAIALVHQGVGVLTLPMRLATSLAITKGLSIHPMPIHLPALMTHLYWHTNALQDSAMQWVHQALLARFSAVSTLVQ
ncbi:LysR family transcriptional regulator [Alteromonas sediminis]|uniref:LysR family transcriptional regulator n=1 Tax=Alteromonas sediminis TaxID=2259342 RepID=A0A3N5Z9G7_9ALTE|nr:LysR family transcriptional regulator [Alteromonas sediminis]RPJ65888.1 LysR family transcriptional regulator [Alteromonas sediminis]